MCVHPWHFVSSLKFPGLILKMLYVTHICKANVSDTLLQGQGHSGRSKGHIYRIGSAPCLLKPLSDYEKIFHMRVHIIETMCRAKVSDTLLQGQGHSKRLKVICT